VLTTELPGRTAAYLVAEVRPQVSGSLQQRLFVEGSDVKAGASSTGSTRRTRRPTTRRRRPSPWPRRISGHAGAGRAPQGARRDPRGRPADYDDAAAALLRAEASVASARAAMESARINLAYTPLKAPISGRIGRSAVTVGAMVTAYQPVALP